MSISPPAKVIIVCISSSKEADGVPTTTPSEVNGNGPLNMALEPGDVRLHVHDPRFFAFRAALSELAWAW